VIGGAAKGRKVRIPKGSTVRPTAGRVKESLFNILRRDFSGARVLDVFAGSGNLSIEALSRGAASAVLIDASERSGAMIRENLRRLGFDARTEVWISTAARALKSLARRNESFELIFLDPPYDRGWVGRTLEIIGRCNLLRNHGILVIEHSAREAAKPKYGSLQLHDQRRYGDTLLSFYKVAPSTDLAPEG
jgi:16S rRNA (guanine(966)-N(2))-methyltransferase RsmD